MMRGVPHADLRESQRIPAAILIKVAVESEGFKVEHDASTIDLSPRGVKLRTLFALIPGERVGIITSGKFRHAIAARVVWARRVETDASSLAGLELLEILPA